MSNTAENTKSVIVERNFPHTPEKLWRALTEDQLVAQWLLKNDFEPVIGRRFQFRNEPVQGWDGVIDCEVLIVEPLKRLSYTWASMGMESVVVFTLTPEENGTHLRMEQSGFRPDQEFAFKGATYGWNNFFGKLGTVLDEGV